MVVRINAGITVKLSLLQALRVESNNMPQRHWFARFRRKTVCVSRYEDMVDLTVGLYAKFHVNSKIDFNYFMNDIII